VNRIPRVRVLSVVLALGVVATVVGMRRPTKPDAAAPPSQDSLAPANAVEGRSASPDLTGRARSGKASFYAEKFTGRTMADGSRMDPQDDNAASNTLPLGTTAKVTNVETGQRARVTIQDRGPHVKGRIIDLSPAKAREFGLDRHDGTADVEVAPIKLPPPD